MELESKKEVDEMMAKATTAGGKEPRKPQSHEWMYNRAFEDPNGHIWEIFWFDTERFPGPGKS